MIGRLVDAVLALPLRILERLVFDGMLPAEDVEAMRAERAERGEAVR